MVEPSPHRMLRAYVATVEQGIQAMSHNRGGGTVSQRLYEIIGGIVIDNCVLKAVLYKQVTRLMSHSHLQSKIEPDSCPLLVQRRQVPSLTLIPLRRKAHCLVADVISLP